MSFTVLTSAKMSKRTEPKYVPNENLDYVYVNELFVHTKSPVLIEWTADCTDLRIVTRWVVVAPDVTYIQN